MLFTLTPQKHVYKQAHTEAAEDVAIATCTWGSLDWILAACYRMNQLSSEQRLSVSLLLLAQRMTTTCILFSSNNR